MKEWIDDYGYQVGDVCAAIVVDEPEGHGEDREDGRWREFWGSFTDLGSVYLFDSNIKIVFWEKSVKWYFLYGLLFILPKIIWILLINERKI